MVLLSSQGTHIRTAGTVLVSGPFPTWQMADSGCVLESLDDWVLLND
jgi:hypothetical protein